MSFWPVKRDLFGVQITAAEYEPIVDAIIRAGRDRQAAVASCFAVHALVTYRNDPKLRDTVNRFAIVAPDGQPIRWALNSLYQARLGTNVRAAELMWRVCESAEKEGVSIYLYGVTPEVLSRLIERINLAFPNLKIAGSESPPFRPLTKEEDEAAIKRINDSGAGVVFLGLGCPKQDYFAAAHVDRINAVQMCLGAAFDFQAGSKKEAPRWMQRAGLEWFFRLCQEPRRLWRRYLVTNTQFICMFARQWFAQKLSILGGRRKASATG